MATTNDSTIARKAINGFLHRDRDAELEVHVQESQNGEITARFKTVDGWFKATVNRGKRRVTGAWVDENQR